MRYNRIGFIKEQITNMLKPLKIVSDYYLN